MEIILYIALLAFLFEFMDSSAGMGFGTCLCPLLFLLGYNPLQVVPVILVSECITGVIAGVFHHEYGNVRFSLKRPLNEATKVTLIVAGIGCSAIFLSVGLAYFSIVYPKIVIKTYVAVLLLAMGLIALLGLRRKTSERRYRPRIFTGFAALAGFNKGIGGGGFGPVAVLGGIFSGIYEKSVVGIVSLAEGIVSFAGAVAFLAIATAGVSVSWLLLPSVFTGSYIAGLASPYMVRVFPNRAWRVIIPSYAFAIGILCLMKVFVL